MLLKSFGILSRENSTSKYKADVVFETVRMLQDSSHVIPGSGPGADELHEVRAGRRPLADGPALLALRRRGARGPGRLRRRPRVPRRGPRLE